jgi:hypothetical protein
MSPLTPYIAGGALLAIVAAGAWIDHRGYQRGYANRDAVAVQQLAEAQKKADKLGADLAAAESARDNALNQRQDSIQTEAQRQQTIILRETASAPRYRDPQCSLTPGVHDAINASRALSHHSPPGGTGAGSVPASAPAAGQ